MSDELRAALADAVLLMDRGELYASKDETKIPEVWTTGGAYVAQFIYRRDAEAFCKVINFLQNVSGSRKEATSAPPHLETLKNSYAVALRRAHRLGFESVETGESNPYSRADLRQTWEAGRREALSGSAPASGDVSLQDEKQ